MEYKPGDFTLLTLLGQGSQANVWLGLENQTQTKVSIKIPKNKFYTFADMKILMEIPKSKYLLEYMGYTKEGWVITKYVEGCDLFTFYEEGKLALLSQTEKLELMLEIIQALQSLHSWNIYHLDIKPENILINGKDVTIIDYGFCHLAGEEFKKCRLTPSYGSPEMLAYNGHPFTKHPITASTDIYSLGVVFYFITRINLPFLADNINTYSSLIKNLTKVSQDKVYNLIVKMMKINPLERPSLTQIKEKIIKIIS